MQKMNTVVAVYCTHPQAEEALRTFQHTGDDAANDRGRPRRPRKGREGVHPRSGEDDLLCRSDVPQVCELTWLLSCCVGEGLLERAHSYKDMVAKGAEASMSLFNYPVLMAADILIYRPRL
jgi:hypothetical protein